MRKLLPTPEVSMEEVLENSFVDYHVKGFDYLCLKRSPTETVKVYFFDGDVCKLPEVVHPHDHRYDFDTHVLAGASMNVWYEEATGPTTSAGPVRTFQRFAYDSPLIGGCGFTHVGETDLREVMRTSHGVGSWYSMGFREVHTIKMLENETVLCLIQYEDQVSNLPTHTFTRSKEPPSLDGMYKRFTADGVMAKIRTLRERAPGLAIPKIV